MWPEYVWVLPQFTHRLARRCSERYRSSCGPSTPQVEQVSMASRSTCTGDSLSKQQLLVRGHHPEVLQGPDLVSPTGRLMVHAEFTRYYRTRYPLRDDLGLAPGSLPLTEGQA